MDIMIFRSSEAVAEYATQVIKDLINKKPATVLGMATGSTPLLMYRRLIEECRRGFLSFREVTTFNLDEYYGVNGEDARSYRAYMQREFFDHIDIVPENTHLPACSSDQDHLDVSRNYEALIAGKGGIDLQVLGLGQNGHIGFNEPTSSLGSRTRIKTLTQGTLNINSQYFSSESQPELAITMGIATILEARQILMIATGAKKAEPVRQFVEGPVSTMCPASALQFHNNTQVLLDEDAASLLANREYYESVQVQKRQLAEQFRGI